MVVRTYYWDAAAASPKRWFHRGRSATRFAVGNAGDLFNIDLVRYLYGDNAESITNAGRRLLLVGSVAHRVLVGDIVCGIGTKGLDVPFREDVRVRAVRGPLTFAAMADAGYDMSGVLSQLDPGLLVGQVYPELRSVAPRRGNVVFVPHYRDRREVSRNSRYSIVDVDCSARELAFRIAEAEFVYSSSLHGIVFAHALGIPCMLVAPVNAEPETKYLDYFESLDLPWTKPLPIDEALRARASDSVPDLAKRIEGIFFPDIGELKIAGVAR